MCTAFQSWRLYLEYTCILRRYVFQILSARYVSLNVDVNETIIFDALKAKKKKRNSQSEFNLFYILYAIEETSIMKSKETYRS